MKHRANEREIMDLGIRYYGEEVYAECLKALDSINRYLGGERVTFSLLKKLSCKPTSILDVGCGSGSFSIKLAMRYPSARIVGVDIDEQAIAYATNNLDQVRKQSGRKLENVSFVVQQRGISLCEQFGVFDVVLNMLVLHHIPSCAVVEFLHELKGASRKAIIINDLQRSRLAYALFWIFSCGLSSSLAVIDGLISIRRSFTRPELEAVLAQAGFSKSEYDLAWHWAFRWGLLIDVEQKNVEKFIR